ncbi:MAG: transposase [bacterium]
MSAGGASRRRARRIGDGRHVTWARSIDRSGSPPDQSAGVAAPHRCADGIARSADPGVDSPMDDPWRTPPRNAHLPVEAYRQQHRPCSITIRAARSTAPFRNPPFNDALIDMLLVQRQHAECDVYAYCLMPDHLHLVTAPRVEGRCVLRYVHTIKSLSTQLAWHYGHRGRLWQPRFYDQVIRSEEAFGWICQYVLENPVRAGLVAEGVTYRWCGEPDTLP